MTLQELGPRCFQITDLRCYWYWALGGFAMYILFCWFGWLWQCPIQNRAVCSTSIKKHWSGETIIPGMASKACGLTFTFSPTRPILPCFNFWAGWAGWVKLVKQPKTCNFWWKMLPIQLVSGYLHGLDPHPRASPGSPSTNTPLGPLGDQMPCRRILQTTSP